MQDGTYIRTYPGGDYVVEVKNGKATIKAPPKR